MGLVLRALFLSILFYLFFPLTALVCLLLFIRTTLVRLLARLFTGHHGMLEFLSQTEWEGQNSVITWEATLRGRLKLTDLVEKFEEKVLGRTEDGRPLFHHHFQHKVTYFLGYPFWSTDTEFNSRNHILSYNTPETPVGVSELGSVRQILNSQPIETKDRSPWKFNVVSAVDEKGEDSTVIFFRLCHALGDGYRVFYSIRELFESEAELEMIKSRRTVNSVARKRMAEGRNVCLILLSFLKFPYDAMLLGIERMKYECPWNPHPRGSRVEALSGPIPLFKLKKGAENGGGGVTSVLLASITAGILSTSTRHFQLKTSDSILLKMTLPGIRTAEDDFPMTPNVILKLPMETAGSGERGHIRRCEEILSVGLKSGISSPYIMSALSSLFNACRFKNLTVDCGVLLISNFPGPRTPVYFNGIPYTDMSYGLQVPQNFPTLCTIMSYNGSVRIRLNGSESVISSTEEAEEILRNIEKEIEFYAQNSESQLQASSRVHQIQIES